MPFPVGDIKLSANFEVNVAKPIDARLVVQNTTDRDNIAFKYSGMIVWVIDDDTHYYLENDLVTWTQIGSSSSLPTGTTIDSTLRWNGLNWVESTGITQTSGNNANINVDAASPSGIVTIDIDATTELSISSGVTEFNNILKNNAARVCSTTTIDSSVTSTYAVSATDDNIILAEVAAATPLTLTLPAGSGLDTGHEIIIKDVSGNLTSTNAITINTSGSDTVETLTSVTMTTPYDTLRLLWSGSLWVTI